MVLAIIGTPSAPAARAVASSPSSWTIFWTPTGASSSGAGISVPSTVVERSRSATSRSIRGTSRRRAKAARLASIVSSVPAPANTYAAALSSISSAARRSSSAIATGIEGFSPPRPRR